MSHHPTYTDAARTWFCAALRSQAHTYDTVAAALQAAGLARPSEGSPAYRDAILAALDGSEGHFPPGWLDALDGPPSMPEGYADSFADEPLPCWWSLARGGS